MKIMTAEQARADADVYREARDWPGKWIGIRDGGTYEIDDVPRRWLSVAVVADTEREARAARPDILVHVPADWKPLLHEYAEAIMGGTWIRDNPVPGLRVTGYADTRTPEQKRMPMDKFLRGIHGR